MVLLIVYLLSSASLIAARYYGYVNWQWHAVSFPLWGPVAMVLMIVIVNILPNWMLAMGYDARSGEGKRRDHLRWYHHLLVGWIPAVETVVSAAFVDSGHDRMVEGFKLGYANAGKDPKKLKHRVAERAVARYEEKEMAILKKRIAKEMKVIENG